MVRDTMIAAIGVMIVLAIVLVVAGCTAGRQSNPSCVAHCYAIARDSDEDNLPDDSPYLHQAPTAVK